MQASPLGATHLPELHMPKAHPELPVHVAPTAPMQVLETQSPELQLESAVQVPPLATKGATHLPEVHVPDVH